MTTTTHQLLFQPLRLGPVTVKNRIVFCAHLTNYAVDGHPSAQHAAYYAARAKGGAGLIITEEHSTHPTDWPYEKLIHGFNPSVVEGYRQITDAVHAHGTPIFAQINHNGGQASSMYSRQAVWAPSPVPDPLFREVPKAISQAEIAAVIDGYAEVAARCIEGGFDGIELQCSHSSIVRGFLSPATNHRTDAYGGPLEHRARLLLEIVDAVRGAIGPTKALGVRLCGDELIAGGTTIDDAIAVATMVEAQSKVDYLNTSIGVATASLFMIEASMAVKPGYATFIPSALRAAVSLPVVAVGRFKDPLQADRALVEGHGDLIGVVRGQIADPDFANKARSGAAEDIRLCLSCNQECVGRMGLNRWLGCIENPRAGREATAPVAMSPRPQRVAVVGAGPAGLQAAISAARAGHRVTIYEREHQPGGTVALAASIPQRAEFGDLVRNQLHEARRLGVEVVVGQQMTCDELVRLAPDHVVVATGSEPQAPWWAPAQIEPGQPQLCDVVDVVAGRAQPSGKVLVVDELGFHQATSVAELLADRGCQVEVASPGMVVGQDLGISLDLEQWWLRAHHKGIAQLANLLVTGLTQGGVSTQNVLTGEPGSREADWVVLAVPARANDALYHQLVAAGLGATRVGDALAPRRAHAAVIDGDRIGAAL